MSGVLGFSIPALLLGSIAAAAALIYLPFLTVGYARAQLGYDTRAPRAMFDKLPPYAQRATWAHQNAFESFVVYAAAALAAYATGVSLPIAGWAAVVYVVARLGYPAFYIADLPVLRSLCFGLGSLSTLILFALSLRAVF